MQRCPEKHYKEVIAMKKVSCVGILVADVIVEPVKGYPEKGLLTPVNSITMHNGGNAMTAAINLSKLGVSSTLVGKVGNDMFGEYLKKCLLDANVKIDGIKTDESVQTSASVLMIEEGSGERSFFHCVGSNAAFSYDDIDFSVIEKSDIVFVTGTYLMDTFDGEQTMRFLKKCKELGKTTVLDVCWDAKGKWGELLNCAMPYIDFFMPSIDEAKKIAERDSLEEISDVFFDNGVKAVVIKCGKEGSYLRVSKEDKGIMIPAYKMENVVDTTGAGDSFCSGFLAALSREEPIFECARVGNAAGAFCVTQKGATSGMPTYERLKAFIEERA